MSDTDFPLCKQAGLTTMAHSRAVGKAMAYLDVIEASQVEKLLANLVAALEKIASCETDEDHTLHMSVTAVEALAKHRSGK